MNKLHSTPGWFESVLWSLLLIAVLLACPLAVAWATSGRSLVGYVAFALFSAACLWALVLIMSRKSRGL